VTAVADGSVPTAGTVLVRMMRVVKLGMCWHGWPPCLNIEQNRMASHCVDA
jgi:hypothetical protein